MYIRYLLLLKIEIGEVDGSFYVKMIAAVFYMWVRNVFCLLSSCLKKD